MGQETQLSQG